MNYKAFERMKRLSMVPADFITYFVAMAGVGATLFGLIFLVISIRPEVVHTESPFVMRQVQVASSYSALLNPLMISLFALIPHMTISTVTCVMSVVGLINTLMMGMSLLRDATDWGKRFKSAPFILISLVIYGWELFYAILLFLAPGDLDTFSHLAILLIIIYLYGIARAWDLVGARQFHLQEMLTPFFTPRVEGLAAGKAPIENSAAAVSQVSGGSLSEQES